MKTVAIVTPAFYKSGFSSEELISLEHLKRYLGGYDKFFVVPDNLNTENHKIKDFHFIKFPRKFFINTKTYNKLLLSESFYQAFKNYEYILIYQLDALVFSDQLLKWCNRGYDYISAPWFNSVIGALTYRDGSFASGGNGGFCLRNIQKSLQVLRSVNKQQTRFSEKEWLHKLWFFWALLLGKTHQRWLSAPADNYPFNEDGFWSLEAPKYLPHYRVAPFKTALQFSFEKFPRKCFELNKRKLPFGCHAWEKYDKKFWIPFLLKKPHN